MINLNLCKALKGEDKVKCEFFLDIANKSERKEFVKMKIFEIDFKGMWGVPSGLIIAANNKEEATMIAKETIKHTGVKGVKEIDTSKPTVVFYESGDY